MFNIKDIGLYYKKTKEKVKDFLLSDNCKESLIFLFFFIISFGFWLLQTLKNDYEADFHIPVRLKNVPDNVVLTSGPPAQLAVRLKDKGTVLVNYMFANKFYPVNIDFNAYKGHNGHARIAGKELTDPINGQLKSSTQLVSIMPDTLEFIYTEGKGKKLPVRLHGSLSTDPLHYITDTIFTPDSVMVYAPPQIGDTLEWASTEFTQFTNLSDTAEKEVNLRPIKGVKYVPELVRMKLPTDIITEKTVEVPLKGAGFPPDKILRTFPAKVTVTFQIGLNRFRDVVPEDFIIEIPYNELLNDTTDRYKVKMKSYPPGISHLRIAPEEIDYLIEQTHDH